MVAAVAVVVSYWVDSPFPKFVVSPVPTFKALDVAVVPTPTDPVDVKEETDIAGLPVRFCARPEVSDVAVPVRPVPGPLNAVEASTVAADTSVAWMLVIPVPVL